MKSLSEFLQALHRRGLVQHVYAEVDANQEIPEIQRRVIAAGGPVLWFHRVKGSRIPLVCNLFGTTQRVDLAFGEDPIRVLETAVELAKHPFPLTSEKIGKGLRLLPHLLRTGSRSSFCNTYRGPKNLTLNDLPLTTSWPEDGGAFCTLPLVYTEHPDGGSHNLGMYRMHRFNAHQTGMHWQIGKGGGFHYKVAEERGAALPVTVYLGGPPALMLSAITPLPENVGELMLAGILAGSPLRTNRLTDHAHRILQNCEFALLGEVRPRERHPEGPFGDHYGYYSLQHDYPVFQCKKILAKADAVFPATVVGKPRQEDYYIGEYLQRLLRPLFPLAMPGIVDLWSYGETGFHSLAAASVKERYAREAMVHAFRVLGEGQLALTKMLLLTDDRSLELSNFPTLLEHVLARFRPETDLYVFDHLSMDTLDYCGPEVNRGSKAILLGLGEAKRTLPRALTTALPAEFPRAKPFCAGCLVVEGPTFRQEPEAARRLAEHPHIRDWPLVILVDDLAKATSSTTAFLWTTFTRFEPAADLVARSTKTERHHLGYEFPIVLDARMKPHYPRELFCDPDIADRVTKRWEEYFPDGMEQGSSDRGHL